MKKRVGISLSKTNFANYVNWFAQPAIAEMVEVVVLSPESTMHDIAQCSGFVLTGGVDIHPSLYNGEIDYLNKPANFQLERDQFEQQLFFFAQQNHLPLLGICRGLQLVNVLLGGSLVQDLGAEHNALHKADGGDKQHEIVITAGSLLFEITGKLLGRVNSAHHQVLHPHRLGRNLKATAWSAGPERFIEAIEWAEPADKPYLMCVQWHPERMPNLASPFSVNIKEHFLSAVGGTNPIKHASN